MQVISLSTVPSSNGTLQDAPVTVTNSSNNAIIQNLQQAILALLQVIDVLPRTLMALQQPVPQAGNATYEAAMEFELKVGRLGNVRTTTLRAFTEEEIAKIIGKLG